jgi:DNA-binding LacI/PurR family transcriptional regulator
VPRSKTSPADRLLFLRVAAAAGCDPRTAMRYMATAQPVAGITGLAIQRALAELGLLDPRAAAPKAAKPRKAVRS